MPENLAVVLHRRARNKSSLNALAAALETDPSLDDLPVYFLDDKDHAPSRLFELCDRYGRVLFASSFFTEQAERTRRLLDRLRREGRTGLFCLAGGSHASGDPEGTLAMGFDCVVQGEGERAFLDVVRALRHGKDLNGVAGIWYLLDGSAVRTPPGPPVDLDAFPPVSFRHGKFGPIEISRGCPFGCRFCQTSRLFGRRMRHRGVEAVADVARRYRERGMRDIRFVTPDAFAYGSPDGRILDLEAAERLLKRVRSAIGAEGRAFFGSFPSEVRPEHVTDEAVALVLRYADNDNIVLGAQSGSQDVLDKCRRGHSTGDVAAAVDRIVGVGLKAYVDFIFGLPVETPDDARRSLEMIQALVDKGAVINVHSFMPLPGTPFAAMAPTEPPDDVLGALHRLVSGGRAFGDWVRQRAVARDMVCGPRDVPDAAGLACKSA